MNSTRKLIASIPELTALQRQRIAETAARHGIQCEFYDPEEEAALHVSDAEILFAFAPDLARLAPKLKWYCTPSAGADRFCREGVFPNEDVILTNCSGAYGITISEHIVMVILEVLRRQKEYAAVTAKRQWIRNLPLRSICGSRITIAGTGDIGCTAARTLRAFQPTRIDGINHTGRNPQQLFDHAWPISHLDEVLKETDILILALPGTDETAHLIRKDQLALLPDRALLVNVGRGSCVDEAALAEEVRSGRLYAALDVFETEPLPADSPLYDCPNALLTPHIAGDMSLPQTVELVTSIFTDNLERYCTGQPLHHVVDRRRGY